MGALKAFGGGGQVKESLFLLPSHSLIIKHTICNYVVQGCINCHAEAERSWCLDQVSVTLKARKERMESRFSLIFLKMNINWLHRHKGTWSKSSRCKMGKRQKG